VRPLAYARGTVPTASRRIEWALNHQIQQNNL
jgi:hypothetical protein